MSTKPQPAQPNKRKPQMAKATGKAKLFLEELAAHAAEQRELIEAECIGFKTDATARDLRRTKAMADFRFFGKTYFPHYLKGDAESLFHTWFFDNVPALIDAKEGKLVNISAPRGEAKSTLGTQLLALWCVVTGRKRFIPVVMDSWDQAAAMLEAIKTELSDNPRLKMDFPEATGRGRVWNAGVVLSANDAKIQAFGARKKMRGLRHGPHRPDLVFLDDIENDENVTQPAQRDKTEDWVTKSVLNLGPPDGSMDVVYLNTILHYDSVANRTHRKPRWVRRKFKAIVRWPDRMDLWQEWEQLFLDEAKGDDALDEAEPTDIGAAEAFYLQHKAEMDKGAIVSWPTMRPLLRLMQIRAEDHHAFDCEYQNDPTNAETALFPELGYWVEPIRDWVFYGAHDPSLGKNNKGRDPCACLVGGYDRHHGVLDVVEARIARMQPFKQIDLIINFQAEYTCLIWGFEAVQFQEFMRQVLVKESAKLGIPVPARPIQQSSDKALRIESLSPHVANRIIRTHPRHTVLNDMLKHYPEAEHDDGPDALEILFRLVLSGAGGLPKIKTGKRR